MQYRIVYCSIHLCKCISTIAIVVVAQVPVSGERQRGNKAAAAHLPLRYTQGGAEVAVFSRVGYVWSEQAASGEASVERYSTSLYPL